MYQIEYNFSNLLHNKTSSDTVCRSIISIVKWHLQSTEISANALFSRNNPHTLVLEFSNKKHYDTHITRFNNTAYFVKEVSDLISRVTHWKR